MDLRLNFKDCRQNCCKLFEMLKKLLFGRFGGQFFGSLSLNFFLTLKKHLHFDRSIPRMVVCPWTRERERENATKFVSQSITKLMPLRFVRSTTWEWMRLTYWLGFRCPPTPDQPKSGWKRRKEEDGNFSKTSKNKMALLRVGIVIWNKRIGFLLCPNNLLVMSPWANKYFNSMKILIVICLLKPTVQEANIHFHSYIDFSLHEKKR